MKNYKNCLKIFAISLALSGVPHVAQIQASSAANTAAINSASSESRNIVGIEIMDTLEA